LRLVFVFSPTGIYNGLTTYNLLVIDNATGTTNAVVSGSFNMAGETIDSLALFNSNAGTGVSHNAFFNSIEVSP
jgi:hypothetical protein